MKMTKWMLKLLTIAMLAIIMSLVTGCGGGGGNDDDSDNTNEDTEAALTISDYAGTWLIEKEGTYAYWIFNENGIFQKKRADEPVDSPDHIVGTFSVVDGVLSGEFTNPGVGTGAIEGTIVADGTFEMNFIEYWHTPAKVVPCVGVRQ